MNQLDTVWTGFAAVTCGAAAGLTGLTFLVVAFRFDTLAVSGQHRSRASQTLSLFVAILIIGALITVPQPRFALGIEMLSVATATTVLLILLNASANRKERANLPLHTGGLVLFVVSVALSGIALAAGHHWGMYAFVFSTVVALVCGVDGAWRLLTRTEMQSAKT